MTTSIPRMIREEIFEYVYEKADEHGYLEKSRPENGVFIENLIKDPRVGGRIRNYVDEERVRTYIKDAILNRYAKDRRDPPRDVSDVLSCIYKEPAYEVDYRRGDHVSLHRVEDGRFAVVARANHLKWETSVRKLLQYVAAAPDLLLPSGEIPDLLVIIFQHGKRVNEGDRRLTERSLTIAGIKCYWR